MKDDHKKVLKRIKIIRGQIDGIIKMIEDDRYCLDISYQVLAVQKSLKSLNNEIISSHLRHCVNDSMISDDEKLIEEKLNEINNFIKKLSE